MKEHKGKHVHTLEYNKISEFIYIGTNACCEAGFDATLKKLGITADISMEENKVDHPVGVDYYVWIPTKNHYAPPLKRLLFGVWCLDYFVKNKVKTYVHCKEGHTRAPTLVAAYYIFRGMSTEKAIALVKKKRPAAHITSFQTKALKKFEKLLRT